MAEKSTKLNLTIGQTQHCHEILLTGSDGSVSSSSRGHSPTGGPGGIFANQSGQTAVANKHQGNTGSAGSYADQGLNSKEDSSRYGEMLKLLI